ncbi:Tyrosine decarboxylase 1 [Platanthera guangdongensis]|uniref:Tyrosine decarboxylase 1 n=1 Tax=Platanthera guangdongensis TaxID=2320717 RepID=A0ABR2MKJ0_9ASPA
MGVTVKKTHARTLEEREEVIINEEGRPIEPTDLHIQARSSTELARKLRHIKQEKVDVFHKSLRVKTTNKEKEVANMLDQNQVQQLAPTIITVPQECNSVEESLNGKVKRNKRCQSMLIDEFVEVQGKSGGRTESLQVNKDISQEGIVAQPNKEAGLGGGVIHGTTSEVILVTLLVARDKILRKDGNEYLSKLTIYASDQTHSALKKACQDQLTNIIRLSIKVDEVS